MSAKWSKSRVPTVMSDQLLAECAAQSFCDTPETKNILEEDGVDFTEITNLKLEFKNILSITNLWEFTSLTELNLSNNNIEKIENIHFLLNLTKLDLSFNNIEVITGLDELINITILNLSYNKITCIENLEELKKLQLLALNNNQLDDIQNVKNLYGFTSIKAASFHSNPLAADEKYRLRVIAYMPNLEYLDCKLVSPEEQKEANKKLKRDMIELEEKDKDTRKASKEQRERIETEALNIEALIEGLSDNQFWDDFLSLNKSTMLLMTSHFLNDPYNDFLTNFRNICAEWMQTGMKDYKRRQDELSEYTDCVTRITNDTKSNSRKRYNEFAEFNEHVLVTIALHDPTSRKQKGENLALIREWFQKLEDLWSYLMSQEVNLTIRINSLHGSFATNMNVLIEECIENIQKVIATLHEAYKEFHHHVTVYYTDWCAKTAEEKTTFIKNIGSEYSGLDPKFIDLLKDPSLLAIVEHGFEMRSEVFNKKEETLVAKLKDWSENVVIELSEKYLEGNRQTVMEIVQYCDNTRKKVIQECKRIQLFE